MTAHLAPVTHQLGEVAMALGERIKTLRKKTLAAVDEGLRIHLAL